MTEDEIYRTSSQYRLWSFTTEKLASIRLATNSLAADGVRTAIYSLRGNKLDGDASSAGHVEDASAEVDCLSVEEEQKLVGFYCIRAMDFADFCDFPTNVKVCTPIVYSVYSLTKSDQL